MELWLYPVIFVAALCFTIVTVSIGFLCWRYYQKRRSTENNPQCSLPSLERNYQRYPSTSAGTRISDNNYQSKIYDIESQRRASSKDRPETRPHLKHPSRVKNTNEAEGHGAKAANRKSNTRASTEHPASNFSSKPGHSQNIVSASTGRSQRNVSTPTGHSQRNVSTSTGHSQRNVSTPTGHSKSNVSTPAEYSQRNVATPTGYPKLDLHNYTLKEAMPVLETFLRSSISDYKRSNYIRDKRFCLVITGRGLHSPEGKPVIKPAVENYLKIHDYTYNWSNPGMVRIDLLPFRNKAESD